MPGRSLRSTPRWHLSPNSSILSTTFITSWRGQLLICTVCLALGIVYYYVRRPVAAILRSRREAVSRAMQAELMSQEVDDKDGPQTIAPTDKGKEVIMGKGKEKRKDVKKRKGSLLKVNVASSSAAAATSATDTAGPSSREESPAPAPARLAVPTPTPKGKSKQHGKGSGNRRDRSISPSSPSPSPSPKPQIRIRHPTSDEVDRLPTIPSSGESPITPTSKSGSDGIETSHKREDHRHVATTSGSTKSDSTSAVGRNEDPALVPLPCSPLSDLLAGPSRSPKPASSNGDISDSTTYSSSALSAAPARPTTQSKSKSRQPPAWQADGFSIVPDASYLPPSTVASVLHKRKKKKDKQSNLPDIFDINPTQSSDNLSRYSQPTSVDNESIATPNSPPQRPTYKGHARKSSLKVIRPPVGATPAELEEYFNEREQIVDSLRAEVGEAKAQEARAREAEQRAKDAEERARKELAQAKRRAAGNAEEQNRIILESLKAYEELYNKTAGMREAAAQMTEFRRGRNEPNAAQDPPVPPMPPYDPHIIEILGRQGPINNGVWVNPSPAPPTPSQPQPPMTPNHNQHHRPSMPMSASYQSPIPHSNGFHPSHSPFPASPAAARMNGFLTPAHPPPPFMGQPYIGPSFAPSTPQSMYTTSPHPGMFAHPHPQGPFGQENLYIPNAAHRRVSDGSSLAGPLTPGIPSSAPSPLPVQIGLGFPVSAPSHSNGHNMQQGSSGESMSAERRVSIEATVMKKKAAAAATSNSDAPSISEESVEEAQVNHGLGLGDLSVDGPTSASASSFDPASSPELGGTTSMSRTSSKSCPSSPDPTSLEIHKGIVEQHAESIGSGIHALCDDGHVANLKASITDPVMPAKVVLEDTAHSDQVVDGEVLANGHGEVNGTSTDGPDESFIPYFPTLACSREENERNQQGLKAGTT